MYRKFPYQMRHVFKSYFSSTQSYTEQLLDTDAEECGDLYLDVAENYMHVKLHRCALPFLEKLVHSETFGQVSLGPDSDGRWRPSRLVTIGQNGFLLRRRYSPKIISV